MENERIYAKIDRLRDSIENSDLTEIEKSSILRNIQDLRGQKVNILITGATGCGKSSTINALFGKETAKVGITPDPETTAIERYDYDNLVLWDSPGLGDGKEADIRNSKMIIDKLTETDSEGNALIDLVLVILDGSSRDLGTSYQLINEVIIPTLDQSDRTDRILVAINQCDVAMKGRHWDKENNKPEPELVAFLEDKVMSVHRRIKEGTGVDIMPIYYSAGYKENGEEQNPYNLSKLLYFIIEHTPKKKRLVYAQNMSQDPYVWQDNDEVMDYKENIEKSFKETLVESITSGVQIGSAIGEAWFGTPGRVIGGAVGGIFGAVGGFFKGLFGR